MAETVTAATGWSVPARTLFQAASTPSTQACCGSCSNRSGPGATTRCGIRARATTVPSSPAATALTEVVPMSMPTVKSSMSPPAERVGASTAAVGGRYANPVDNPQFVAIRAGTPVRLGHVPSPDDPRPAGANVGL